MALQDLTPQLRTRLSRMERAVGWFVLVAFVLLAVGFGYYVYNTAERKGWFQTKATYYIYTRSASGLKVGDPVNLMGLDVGRITRMQPMPADNWEHNMFVEFEIRSPYYGYLWTEGSRVEVVAAGLLGNRSLEVTKGTGGYPTYVFNPVTVVGVTEVRSAANNPKLVLGQDLLDPATSNLLARALTPLSNLPTPLPPGLSNLTVMDRGTEQKLMTGIWDPYAKSYRVYHEGDKYELQTKEAPAVSEQLQSMVAEIEHALPGIFDLTNALQQVLANSAAMTSNLNAVAVGAKPAVSNLTAVLSQINRPGALGDWLFPTNVSRQLEGTLGQASLTLSNADTNLLTLASNLNVSLDNLAGMTANLREQVAANPTLVRGIADTIVHADQLIQGLKRFWLFRNLFPTESGKAATTNAVSPPKPLASPKAAGPA